jgi:hypothetical protein
MSDQRTRPSAARARTRTVSNRDDDGRNGAAAHADVDHVITDVGRGKRQLAGARRGADSNRHHHVHIGRLQQRHGRTHRVLHTPPRLSVAVSVCLRACRLCVQVYACVCFCACVCVCVCVCVLYHSLCACMYVCRTVQVAATELSVLISVSKSHTGCPVRATRSRSPVIRHCRGSTVSRDTGAGRGAEVGAGAGQPAGRSVQRAPRPS